MRDDKAEPVSVWTIAGGILLALVVLKVWDAWQTRRAVEQFNAQVGQILADAPRHAPVRPTPTRRQAHQTVREPLAPGERCIDGAKIAKSNGQWIQTGTCP